MAKIGRIALCPCGSGKKYKKCCLLLKDGKGQKHAPSTKFIPVYTQFDQLSNSVVDLIKQNRLDEAETASRKLLTDYPDQVDGLNRLAMVYEARGEKSKAADYYRKAANFAKSMPVFDKQIVKWFLSDARRMKEGM
jgi:tetratricopeptide (TPR) repeat protein